MKLVIAHLPPDALESVRTELLELGVPRITISEVHSSGPRSTETLRYRGASLHINMRTELRLECITTAEQSPFVVSILRGHMRARSSVDGQIAVFDVEQLHEASPQDEIFVDDPRVQIPAPAGE